MTSAQHGIGHSFEQPIKTEVNKIAYKYKYKFIYLEAIERIVNERHRRICMETC